MKENKQSKVGVSTWKIKISLIFNNQTSIFQKLNSYSESRKYRGLITVFTWLYRKWSANNGRYITNISISFCVLTTQFYAVSTLSRNFHFLITVKSYRKTSREYTCLITIFVWMYRKWSAYISRYIIFFLYTDCTILRSFYTFKKFPFSYYC